MPVLYGRVRMVKDDKGDPVPGFARGHLRGRPGLRPPGVASRVAMAARPRRMRNPRRPELRGLQWRRRMGVPRLAPTQRNRVPGHARRAGKRRNDQGRSIAAWGLGLSRGLRRDLRHPGVP
jgi:hypothetical protein